MKKLISFAFLAAFLWSCSSNGTKYETYTMTFEHIPAMAVAVDKYGSNAYDGYAGTQYKTYADASTGLTWGINEVDGLSNLYSGGVIVSSFTDRQDETFANQCSVNWGTDGANNNGGNSNSKYFAVVYKDTYTGNSTTISFIDPTKPVEFKSLYICNTTFVTKVVTSGGYGNIPAESNGWLKAVITGYNGNTTTGSVEYYLVDYRTATSPGVAEGWHKVDLTPLGKNVTKLEFDAKGSNSDPIYGLNTPAYFCIDDLTFKREESE